MKKPVATYRVQLNRDFDFYDFKNIIPYLSQLGISHIYASPILKARHGSTHGYDVTDPDQINDELGGAEAFDDLCNEVAFYGLEWLQDIVPNHMSYSPENKMISDVMEKEVNSEYYSFFDIDWNHPSQQLRGRILAPFLAHSYKECLERGQIKLVYDDGFVIRYHDMKFPVKLSTYKKILHGAPKAVAIWLEKDRLLKQHLQELYRLDKTTKEFVEETIKKYNSDISLLDDLLSSQVFVLEHWRVALRQIDYRRFSDIIELICLHAEKTDAFERTHGLIFKLLTEGKISALRIDHVDGLYDPEQYLERLRKIAPDVYVIVEKILMNRETLPCTWPIQGTTGYDFINSANGLFVERNAEAKFDAIYREFTGRIEEYTELVCKCKRLVIEEYFRGDIENLTYMFIEALKRRTGGRRLTFQKLEKAIIELLSSFPVYRTYLTETKDEGGNIDYLRKAFLAARQSDKDVEDALTAMEELLLDSRSSQDALKCIMRLQQFTSPVMAKGLEDTAFYVYDRFLSLNEVGGNPSKFGWSIEDFHTFNRERHVNWPYSMNSTTTHDTKRGEDVRARLNVLSEIPSEFRLQVSRWADLNFRKKKRVNGKLVPNRNEEYYIYQTLLGAFPSDRAELPEFTGRLKNHMVKAIREAKINSTWLDPNLRYEEAATSFVTELLDRDNKNEFLEEFLSFQKKIASYGFFNSLAQTLLKITCPGIPDFYQGAELLDLNLVDPDNRRRIDYSKRKNLLREILILKPGAVQGLLNDFKDGKAKLYEIFKSLAIRREKRELFEEGAYVPLCVKGTHRNHVVSFCRRKGANFAVTIVPRFLANLTNIPSIPAATLWKDTYICLPPDAPKSWREILTDRNLFSSKFGDDNGLRVGELLEAFPTALLLSDESG